MRTGLEIRLLLFVIAICILCSGRAYYASAQENEDTERRLSRVTVSRASPFVGTLHVKLVVSPSSDSDTYGSSNIEMLFVPFIREEGGSISPTVTSEDGRHRLTTALAEGKEANPYRLLPTEKMYLPSGEYLLSQIRFIPNDREDAEIKAYCLSGGTFAFDIRAQDVLFLGRLVLKSPNEIDSQLNDEPIFSDVTPIDQLSGWRRRPDNLLKIVPSQISFDATDIFCPDAQTAIQGW